MGRDVLQVSGEARVKAGETGLQCEEPGRVMQESCCWAGELAPYVTAGARYLCG